MYELCRASLAEHFENLRSLDSDNMKNEYRDVTDKSDSFVESVINALDFAINLYHSPR